MISLDLNIVATLILSIILYLLGNFLTNKIYILKLNEIVHDMEEKK